MNFGPIDSHCHLNHKNIEGAGSPGDIMALAHAAGVPGALTVCCRISEEFEDILNIARANKNVWCTVGTHPHDAGMDAEKNITLEKLIALANADTKVIGIGESGLDYYYNHSDHAAQGESFRKHIRASIATGLPLVVHARDADDDIIKILREEGAGTNPRLKGVMHCFSSTRKMAEDAVSIGFYISFSGILTFKKAQELRDIARDIPMDRILVETDSPFLAPEPYRGRINQPAHIIETVRVLANIKKLDERGAVACCNENFFQLFDRAVLTP